MLLTFLWVINVRVDVAVYDVKSQWVVVDVTVYIRNTRVWFAILNFKDGKGTVDVRFPKEVR